MSTDIGDLPLAGKVVIVTRPRERAAALARLLQAAGAEVLIAPVIRAVPPESMDGLDRAIERLRQYQWVVLTSGEGVDAFIDRLLGRGRDVRDLAGLRLAAIGRKTAARLREYGLRADLVPDSYRAEDLADTLIAAGVAGETVLVPRSAISRRILVEMLINAGAFVDEVASYTVERVDALPDVVVDSLRAGASDLVTFTSSSTVEQFMALAAEAGVVEKVELIEAACIGPITAETAARHGLRVAAVADEYTVEGLVAAIVDAAAARDTDGAG